MRAGVSVWEGVQMQKNDSAGSALESLGFVVEVWFSGGFIV